MGPASSFGTACLIENNSGGLGCGCVLQAPPTLQVTLVVNRITYVVGLTIMIACPAKADWVAACPPVLLGFRLYVQMTKGATICMPVSLGRGQVSKKIR